MARVGMDELGLDVDARPRWPRTIRDGSPGDRREALPPSGSVSSPASRRPGPTDTKSIVETLVKTMYRPWADRCRAQPGHAGPGTRPGRDGTGRLLVRSTCA